MEFTTITDVAEILGVSVDTIRRWNKKGLIKSSRDSRNHRVFNLAEVERLQAKLLGDYSSNNYQVLSTPTQCEYTSIDLFAGAGGTALGLENAGISHLLLNEVDKNAVETLQNNRPEWNTVHGDIAKLDFSLYKGTVDILEGGFPCQAFSYAGQKKGFNDTRGTLFYEFARAVNESKPKIAIGENVRGLLTHDGGKTLATMLEVLDEIGYKAKYKVLRSQYFDVPQKRERLVIIAVRKDLDLPILFPKERDYTITLREAIGDVPPSQGQVYSDKKRKVMELIPPGGCWRDLPVKIQKEYMLSSYFMGGGKTGMARRLSWDEPSLTLTCVPAQKQTERCHPSETRPLNIREYARIQTFPDEWIFTGSISSQYRQIGNAVPVNLGFHIGSTARAMLDGVYDKAYFDNIDEEDEGSQEQQQFVLL